MPAITLHLPKFLTDPLQKNHDLSGGSVAESRHTVIEEPWKPRTYPQAWLALFLLVLLRAVVSIFQYTFSVVPTLTAELFHVTLTAVNWLANVQSLVYVFLCFFTGWIFEKLGVKRTLLLAGLLNVAGACIRYVAVNLQSPSFILTMVGQVVGSAAAPLSLNIMTMFAGTWFTENRRATAGIFVASNYGGIIGMFVLPNLATSADRIPFINLIVVIASGAVLAMLVFMPARPPTPPSNIVNDDKRPPFWAGLKMLCKKHNFWILFLVHSFNVGLSIAFGTIFTQIIAPFGYSNAQAGQINAVSFFAGTLGCMVAGPVLDQTKQHKLFLRLVAPMVFVTDLGMIFLFQANQYATILFVTALNQFFLSFLVPVAVELGSETSYPVADATSNSIMWQGAQAFGFIIMIVMDYLRDENGDPPNNMQKALIFQACLAAVIIVLAFAYNGRMARTEAINEQNRIDQEFLEK